MGSDYSIASEVLIEIFKIVGFEVHVLHASNMFDAVVCLQSECKSRHLID